MRASRPPRSLQPFAALLGAAVFLHGAGSPGDARAAAAPTGVLSVMNQTTGLPGVTLPTAYTITTTCTPFPLTTPYQAVWVHSANDGIGGPIPAPNTCTVTAAPLAPIGHVQACNGGSASWTTTITPATVTVPIGPNNTLGAITYVSVKNTLKCDVPAAGGRLTIRKIVINPMAATIPATFSITPQCTPGGPFLPAVQLGTGPGVTLLPVIPANRNCKVTEPALAPIKNVPGCQGGSASWTTSYMPASVTIAANTTQTLTVTNSLKCDPPPATGALRVLKSVNNATGMPVTMPTMFAIKLDCAPSGPQQTLSVPVGNTGMTVASILAQSHCTVSEPPPPSLAHVEGCQGGSASWTTTITPAQPVNIAANATMTVTVRNTLTCDKKDNPGAPQGPAGENPLAPRSGFGLPARQQPEATNPAFPRTPGGAPALPNRP